MTNRSCSFCILSFLIAGALLLQAQALNAAVQSTPEGEAAQTNAPARLPIGIPAAQAKAHIGERNTVCGVVAGGRYLESSKAKTTFLNLDKPYPDNSFTILIPETVRNKFKGAPEEMFKDKMVCVTGLIKDYKGMPEIVLADPSDLTVVQETKAADTNTVQKVPAPNKAP